MRTGGASRCWYAPRRRCCSSGGGPTRAAARPCGEKASRRFRLRQPGPAAAVPRRRGAAFPAARAGNGIARAIVVLCLSHFSILKRHIVRKREGQRSAARPRHICQTATGLAAALPFVNRGGDESRGGMRETAGKERATTIAARSWRRSPRISSPLSFLRRLPTSPLSKPHLLQATGDHGNG